MDRTEPHWRLNSSFSPLSRRWDCRFRSDGASYETQRVHISGSSLSSHSKGSRSVMSSDQYLNHHYSASDGALSYSGSPSDNFRAPRWTPPPSQRFDLGEFSTPTGGARPRSSHFTQCNERCSVAGASVSNSLGSPSPCSESSSWVASSSKHPVIYPPRNFSGRRSFMSKPVYPLLIRSPIPDGENYGFADANIGSRMMQGNIKNYPESLEDASSPDLKFHKSLTALQKMEASPEAGTSSRREGFRWSNASSYDFGFDGDTIDLMDPREDLNLRSPMNAIFFQKCGLCERLLSQKSPWTSHRMVRSSDMPITGILPCRHVFHADCLEEATPGSQIHDPPCPLCLKLASNEGSISFSEPLQVPPRSSQGEASSSVVGPNPGLNGLGLKRNQSLPASKREGSFVKNHFKKRFSFKGKVGKELFRAKIFGSSSGPSTSSSSPPCLRENWSQPGSSKSRKSSRLSGLRA